MATANLACHSPAIIRLSLDRSPCGKPNGLDIPRVHVLVFMRSRHPEDGSRTRRSYPEPDELFVHAAMDGTDVFVEEPSIWGHSDGDSGLTCYQTHAEWSLLILESLDRNGAAK